MTILPIKQELLLEGKEIDTLIAKHGWPQFINLLAKTVQQISKGRASVEYVGDVPWVYVSYETDDVLTLSGPSHIY